MAKTILTNAFVSVGGTDISDHVDTVAVTMTAEDIDLTAMGAVSRSHAPGLRNDSVTLNLFTDEAAGKVNSVLAALVGVAAGAVIIVKPVNAAVSTGNPSYTMTGVLLNYEPINGKVGTASMTSVTFEPADGSFIVRATT